jgi:hypothetical protein
LYTADSASAARKGARLQALACIGDMLFAGMRASLAALLTMYELDDALKNMALGKAPGPDSVTVEFYKIFWYMIDEDYLKMVLDAMQKGSLSTCIIQGVVSLLHKGRQRGQLNNWRPITLLNIGYKLFAKALQRRL